MQLFRPEALRSQDKLHGDVSLVPPVSWQILGSVAAATVGAAALFLSLASYAQVTVVTGRVDGDRGMIRAVPTRAGTIDAVLTAEGGRVVKGQALFRMSIATGGGGSTLEDRRADAVKRRDEAIGARMPALRRAADARIAGLDAQRVAADAEAAAIAAQISQQSALVEAARQDLARMAEVSARGFISQQDMRRREEALALRRQTLAQMQASAAAAQSRARTAAADVANARAEFEVSAAQVETDRAVAAADAADGDNVASFEVVASASGTVAGLDVERGDAVAAGATMLTIVPDGSGLRARLEVPASAAGMIEEGQPVRIAVDAYPFQTYGTIDGIVKTVATTTMPVTRPDGTQAQMFLVRASMADDAVRAYGRRRPLRPGMTLTARITTRSRSLMEWLLDPLYAVARR